MGCNLEFHVYSGCFSSSSYSPAYGLNLRLHSHEFLFPTNESQTAFPWVPIPLPMNLRLHSHEFLFPAKESQNAFPWVPIPHSGCFSSSSCSMPVNLRMHSHEFLFDACESQNVLPWVQVPISLPMDSRLRLHSMSSYSHAKFLESFGWVPPMSYHPYSKRAHRSPKNRILARFWVHPYTYHMGTPKIA